MKCYGASHIFKMIQMREQLSDLPPVSRRLLNKSNCFETSTPGAFIIARKPCAKQFFASWLLSETLLATISSKRRAFCSPKIIRNSGKAAKLDISVIAKNAKIFVGLCLSFSVEEGLGGGCWPNRRPISKTGPKYFSSANPKPRQVLLFIPRIFVVFS